MVLDSPTTNVQKKDEDIIGASSQQPGDQVPKNSRRMIKIRQEGLPYSQERCHWIMTEVDIALGE